MNFIADDYFLLYDSEPEFRALSYEIYPKAVKSFKFLEGQSEMIYLFIKDAHKVKSLFTPYDQGFFISEGINEWINDTYKKYGVNIYNFCYEWAHYFYEYPDICLKGISRRVNTMIRELNTRVLNYLTQCFGITTISRKAICLDLIHSTGICRKKSSLRGKSKNLKL
jgi:hypothetical protein